MRDINGPGLIEELGVLAAEWFAASDRPVLYLTNDHMVETVGRNAQSVSAMYRLSWLNSAEVIVELLQKSSIERRCAKAGLHYPLTITCDTPRLCVDLSDSLEYPVILKPVRPLSRFKTIVARTAGNLRDAIRGVNDSFPVIIQQLIPGDDRSIRFAAAYFERGRVTARFEGRKLRSRPMGHTTIAVSEPSDAIHFQLIRFFADLDLTGPASLEVKRGPDGRDWIIEPTVGRTDFWVGLCIAGGVNIPLIEYLSMGRITVPTAHQSADVGWINGERDPTALLWLALNEPATLARYRWRGVFADRRDWRPTLVHLRKRVGTLPARLGAKVLKLCSGGRATRRGTG